MKVTNQMWIYVAGLVAGLATGLIQRLYRTRIKLLTSAGEWDLGAIERYVMRCMGMGVVGAWLMWTLVYYVYYQAMGTIIYSAMTAVMAGVAAGLTLASNGRRTPVRPKTLTPKKLAQEIAAVKRAGSDAWCHGLMVSVWVVGLAALCISTAETDLTIWVWLIAWGAVGVHWLKDKAIAYKTAAQQFMTDTGGLSQEVADLDDMRKDPTLAPEAVKLLLPTPLIALLLTSLEWVSRRLLR